MATVSANMGERLEEDERGGMVQGSHGAMGNANGGEMCAAERQFNSKGKASKEVR